MHARWTETVFPLSLVAAAAVLAFAQGPAPGSEPPKLRGETLDGKKIVLPDAAAAKITLLVISASKKGGELTGAWRQHFVNDFGSDPRVTYYGAALLQSAPAVFRGVIRAGMRSGIPAREQGHVVTSGSDETAWKAYLGMTDDALPAALLLDASGHVRWSYIGIFDLDHYGALKAAASALLGR